MTDITVSGKLRRWVDPASGQEGLSYWCQGCDMAHGIRTKGPSAWDWNGDMDKPVFSPSVLTSWDKWSPAARQRRIDFEAQHGRKPTYEEVPHDERHVCHTFVGCNGAQPGEVIFLSDCSHALAGTVQPFPDLPDWMRD